MSEKNIRCTSVPFTGAECSLILRLAATAHDDGCSSSSTDVRAANYTESVRFYRRIYRDRKSFIQ